MTAAARSGLIHGARSRTEAETGTDRSVQCINKSSTDCHLSASEARTVRRSPSLFRLTAKRN